MSISMFIPPNTCPQCEANGVPAKSRSIFLTGHQFICGYCGNNLDGSPSGELSSAVTTAVRTLLQHGLFHLDPSSQHNPLTLFRLDGAGSTFATVKISYSHEQTDSRKADEVRYPVPDAIYRVKQLHEQSPLPEAIRQACELLARIQLDNSRPAMTMADVARDRKTVHLEINKEKRLSNPTGFRFAYDVIRFELTWTTPRPAQIPAPLSLTDLSIADLTKATAEGLQILADYTALLTRCSSVLRGGSSSPVCLRRDHESMFHPSAIARVLDDLTRQNFVVVGSPGSLATGDQKNSFWLDMVLHQVDFS